MRNGTQSAFAQHMPARYDWLTRLPAARSGWSWHPLLSATQANLFYPGEVPD